MEKIDKIVELDIDMDIFDKDGFDETGVDIVSIVDAPAIKSDFMYFNENVEAKKHKWKDGNCKYAT